VELVLGRCTCGKRIDYEYNKNGELISKTFGKMQDTYSYDAIGNLIGYQGYDGYKQEYQYSALGIRTGKVE
jgi:YD repeat-containing protein